MFRTSVTLATLLLISACGALETRDRWVFRTTQLASGMRTWELTLPTQDISTEEQALPEDERKNAVAKRSGDLQRSCPDGWDITQSSISEDQQHMMLAGRCTEKSAPPNPP